MPRESSQGEPTKREFGAPEPTSELWIEPVPVPVSAEAVRASAATGLVERPPEILTDGEVYFSELDPEFQKAFVDMTEFDRDYGFSYSSLIARARRALFLKVVLPLVIAAVIGYYNAFPTGFWRFGVVSALFCFIALEISAFISRKAKNKIASLREALVHTKPESSGVFAPFAREVTTLVESLAAAREQAEAEAARERESNEGQRTQQDQRR